MEYGGGRTAETIVSWVEKKTGPVATTLDSVDVAKKFVEDNAIAVVGFFADLEGDAAKAFKVIFQIFVNQMKGCPQNRRLFYCKFFMLELVDFGNSNASGSEKIYDI